MPANAELVPHRFGDMNNTEVKHKLDENIGNLNWLATGRSPIDAAIHVFILSFSSMGLSLLLQTTRWIRGWSGSVRLAMDKRNIVMDRFFETASKDSLRANLCGLARGWR
ncbi:MAG: hypothetical protein AAGC81_17280, partial [Pseudomonadota bacterium]